MHAATKRRPIARQRNQREVCWARAMSSQEACRVLGVDNTCSRQELRAAYMARIKEVSSSCFCRYAIPHSIQFPETGSDCLAGQADTQHVAAAAG